MRIACLDIGTNTLLMLVADVDPQGELTVIQDFHRIVRLGEGLQTGTTLSTEALQRAVECLKDYRTICQQLGVDRCIGVCTSAVRRASNQDEVISVLSTAIGAPLSCISGDEEARLTFLGSAIGTQSCTVIDIGGGSTEVVVGVHTMSQAQLLSRVSFEVGAVRLRDEYLMKQPLSKEAQDAAYKHVKMILLSAQAPPASSTFVGVAGTPTSLAAMEMELSSFDEQRIHGFTLSPNHVRRWLRRLAQLSLEQTKDLPGVHPQRADILVAGVLILDAIMELYSIPSITVSTRGLRYGVALDLIQRSGRA